MLIHRLQSVYLILEIKRQRSFFQPSHPQFLAGLHMRSTAGSLRQVQNNEENRRLPKGKESEKKKDRRNKKAHRVCLADEKNETACIRNMQPPSYQTFQFTLFVRFVVTLDFTVSDTSDSTPNFVAFHGAVSLSSGCAHGFKRRIYSNTK